MDVEDGNLRRANSEKQQGNQFFIMGAVAIVALVFQVFFQGFTMLNTGHTVAVLESEQNAEPPTPNPEPTQAPSPVACGYSNPDFASLRPFSSDLLTIHLDPTDNGGAYIEASTASLTAGIEFGVTALEQGGEYSHFQTTEGSGFVWMMRLSKDQPGTFVDLLQVDLSTRYEDTDLQGIWSDSRLPGLRYKLPIIGTNSDANDGGCQELSKVIDARTLVASGFFGLTEWFSSCPFTGGQPVIDIDTAKSFRHNIDFTVVYSNPGSLGERPREHGARFCIYSLPSPKMIGRRADDRAGYFFESFRLLGDYTQESWPGRQNDKLYHPTVKLINRYQLPNSRCAAELNRSSTKLHFYVDPTTPTYLWEASVAGINMWNVAFQGAGYGIEAHKPDDADWPANYDNADICFSTISWATGSPGSVFAIGQSVKDPRSGEVLKANIIFSLGFLEIWMGRRIVYAAMSASPGLRKEMRFLTASEAPDALWDMPPPNGSLPLEFRDEKHQLWSITQNPSPEQSLAYLLSGIIEVTAHEVGHTIGLRHNFRGTISISFDDAHRTSRVNEVGLSSSVMDYNGAPYLSSAKRAELQGTYGADVPDAADALYFSPVVGAYDKWVVKYGYLQTDEELSGSCDTRGWCNGNEQLASILAEYDNADFTFATDLTADDFDPYTVRRDLTADPIAFFGEQFEVGVEAMAALFTRTMEEGLPYSAMYYPFTLCMRSIHGSATFLLRFLGGVTTYRKHEISANCTQVGAPCARQGNTPVSESDQARALNLILDSIVDARFDPPAWYQKEATEVADLYSNLHELVPVNVANYVSSLKMRNLASLLSVSRIGWVRLSESLLDKADGELVQWLLGQITARLFSTDQTAEEMRTTLRSTPSLHNVRAEYVKILATYASTDPIVLACMNAESDALKTNLTAVLGVIEGDGAADVLEKFFVTNQIASLPR